jgi:pimeloyl-ACP methyl ester carboxylesterase
VDHGQRGLRPLRQAPQHQLRHQQRGRRPGGGQRIHTEGNRRAQAAHVRHFFRGTEGGAVHPEGSPTLEQRKKKLPEFIARNRRPIDRAFVHSIFQRDHPGTADEATIEAFADAILALDDSMPTGTYVDMCSKLPLLDPAKITVPSIILRGEHDGIAGMDDLLAFFKLLPNMNKQFSVMAGISHASFQQKNYMMVYHILHAFYAMQEPVYKG